MLDHDKLRAIARLLTAAGADLEAKSSTGRTPLDVAVTSHAEQCIKELLAARPAAGQ